MGFFQDQFKRLVKPIVDSTIEQMQKTELQKSQTPKVTEVPTQMQIGYGYTGSPRRKYGSVVDFETLRTFSVVYDVARVCINHRKRQINNLEWNIVPKDSKANIDKFRRRIDQVTEFFEEPVKGMEFREWLDRLIEDLLVIDAAVLWKDKLYGGKVVGLLPIDGSTIRLRVEQDGTTPEPPEIAYEQIISGEVYAEYTTDEMYYKYMNPRTNTPYGLSPLECLVIGVDGALRSQMANNNLFSEGTVPEGFLGMPTEWTVDQIKDFQGWFDAMLSGNTAQTSRIKMVPGGKGVGYMPTKKADEMRYLEFEKWLLLKTCAMFDVQPSDIGFIENNGMNSVDTQKQLGNQRGLVPMANFIKQFITRIIAVDFGMSDLKFEWRGLQVVDDEFELERSKMMLEHGGMSINELRVGQGLDPLKNETADMPMIYTSIGPTPLSVVDKQTEEALSNKKEEEEEVTAPSAVKDEKNKAKSEFDELEKWETKAINYMKKGKGLPKFETHLIDKSAVTLIKARLAVARSKEEIKVAFKPFKNDAQERSLISEALTVSEKISGFKRDKYERAR